MADKEKGPIVGDIIATQRATKPIEDEFNRPTGTVKWFNVAKGFGFVIDDETQEELFVHQSSLNMGGFRSLEEGERVSYFINVRASGKEATAVSAAVPGNTLKGSSIRPLGKKKNTTLRCYKCGKFAKHKAKNCPNIVTDDKVCYTCNSTGHKSNVCPVRQDEKDEKKKLKETKNAVEKKEPVKLEEKGEDA